MKRFCNVATIVGLLWVIGCVMIPDTFEARIYVDIRHIEEQADQVMDYVQGKSDTLPDATPAPAESEKKTSWLRQTWDYLLPIQVAYAQELDESSPRVKQIADAMRARNADVEKAKKTGAVGENNRGFLELKKSELLSGSEEVNSVQRLIAADNEDRKALYQEIARLNKANNVDVSTLESVYAKKRRERAQPGELVQLPDAGAEFDEFKAGALGKRLGAKCQAGAWVNF
ncbi:MAG: DUF1318 domain-containing protein [Candidatus Hydrogenedentota bacterium]